MSNNADPSRSGKKVEFQVLNPRAYCHTRGMSGNGTTPCADNINGISGMCGFDVVDVILARRQNLEFKISILERSTSHAPRKAPAITLRREVFVY